MTRKHCWSKGGRKCGEITGLEQKVVFCVIRRSADRRECRLGLVASYTAPGEQRDRLSGVIGQVNGAL